MRHVVPLEPHDVALTRTSGVERGSLSHLGSILGRRVAHSGWFIEKNLWVLSVILVTY
jgi:hypothetical protein